MRKRGSTTPLFFRKSGERWLQILAKETRNRRNVSSQSGGTGGLWEGRIPDDTGFHDVSVRG